MSLVGMKEVLRDAVHARYAVGAFDTMDHLFTESIILAAEETNTPVIIMVGDFNGPIDADVFYPYLVERLRSAKVPCCLHFDHGPSFEACARAIKRGCTSVMIDGSALPFDENVAVTKKVIEMAHASGIDVEGEIGSVGRYTSVEGADAASLYTDPDDALAFAEKSGVDLLAVSIGTVHGVYKSTPVLDIDRLAKIRAKVDLPLVLHGGSGLSAQDFKNVVGAGINKVNAFTNLSVAVAAAVAETVKGLPEKSTSIPIIKTAIDAGKDEVIRHIKMFETKQV